MAPEQKHDRNGRVLKDWAPLVGLGLCTTWLIYLGATQLKRGFGGLNLAEAGWSERFLLAPVEALGATGTYLLLACLASLCYLLWSKKRVDQLPRRAIGLPLLLLALSAFSALAEGDSQIWGGSFGGILESSFLFFGKPLAFIMALGLMAFGLVMSRDWFFYDSLRRLLTGGAAAPAFALGMGSSGAVRDQNQRRAQSKSLQITNEPGDDFDGQIDFAPAPFSAGLTALAPANEDDSDPLAEIAPETKTASLEVTSNAALGRSESASLTDLEEPNLGRFLESEAELSNPPLTQSPEDRKKLPEIDDEASEPSDDSIEDFLAEDSSEEIAEDEELALDELPELDWSGSLDDTTDTDLFAELASTEVEAAETAAEVGKEPEMFASTETPVLDEPVIGWNEDEDESEDVDWDDDNDSDDDDDFDDDDDEDDDDDSEDDDDDDSDDDYDSDDDDDYEDDYGEDDGDDDDYRDARRDHQVAAQATEAAPAASISFSLTDNELEELFEDEVSEAPTAEALVVEPAPLFPALEVDEEELFELDADDSLEAPSWDTVVDSPEIEIQSLLFPEETTSPVEPTAKTAEHRNEDNEAAPAKNPRAGTPSLLNLDEDWAPWGEDSAPARPAAMMAAEAKAETGADTELPAELAEVATNLDSEPEAATTNAASEAPQLAAKDAESSDEPELAAEVLAEEAAVAATKALELPTFEEGDEAPETLDYLVENRESLSDAAEIETLEDLDEGLEFDPIELESLELEVDEAESVRGSAKPQAGPGPDFGLEFGDPLFDQAAELCLSRDTCRISFLQRNLDVDFARAAALIERMEAEGLVGPYSASGHHEILVTLDQWLTNR